MMKMCLPSLFLLSGLTFTTPTSAHPFLIGAATAAHQVEGGNTNNDWYLWEKAGKTKDLSGIAVDHYHRYEEDFNLAKSLGHNVHRLSIEWSRVEPEPGTFNEQEFHHYRNVLLALKKRNIKVVLTLHHFTDPIWFAKKGAWLNEQAPADFKEFTQQVVNHLGDLVDYYITFNEPNIKILGGYASGVTPPGLKDFKNVGPAFANLFKAHAFAYQIIHQSNPMAMVSIAHHMRVFSAARRFHPIDRILAYYFDRFWNEQILDAMITGVIRLKIPLILNYTEVVPSLKNTLDFVGVNYYSRDFVRFDLGSDQKFRIIPPSEIFSAQPEKLTDNGWEIYPEGFYQVLMQASRPHLPIMVTENGIADAKDSKREKFIRDHFQQMKKAMTDGAPVFGYLHWSLMDNFEWLDGFGPRFGLVEMDYQTLERKIRPSARILNSKLLE